MTNASTRTPQQIANALNRHHQRTHAGFYPSIGGRYFGARVTKGQFQITPDHGDTWETVNPAVVTFKDHNARPVRGTEQTEA